MNNSMMVVATKYKLLTPKSIKDGTWDENGNKKAVVTDQLVPRDVIERCNVQVNNEMWVINEEKTADLPRLREEANERKAIREQQSKIDAKDIMSAMMESMKSEPKPKKVTKKAEKKPEPVEVNKSEELGSMTIEALKTLCDDRDISYHHKAGKSKLIELLS